MNIQNYLNRIHYKGELNPSLNALKALQKKHVLHIPFESLDIYYGYPITLNMEAIYQKVIDQKRGGFCYELNGLFYELLSHIGFQVKRVSARVYHPEKKIYGPEFDHLALIVQLNNEQYLCDVGFGRCAFAPLILNPNQAQADERANYLLDKYEEAGVNYWRLHKGTKTKLEPEYIFTEQERTLEEYTEMCHYHQTNPNSPFPGRKLITIATERGRITLVNDRLIVNEAGETQISPINNEKEFQEKLHTYFGISIQKNVATNHISPS